MMSGLRLIGGIAYPAPLLIHPNPLPIPQVTYEWLALDQNVIQDAAWKCTAVNRINALKSNREIGYREMDQVCDPKVWTWCENEV